MMVQFLKIIQKGEIQSQLEIAQQLKVSPEMVVEIARDLTRRGYLSEYNAECYSEDAACNSCSVSNACHVMGRTWSLTEKGTRYLKT